ncbi:MULTISPECIES: hypothetical protein [unclassified Anabaena]|uniref:hypothetical protein n=1 Tax=unclassified Anabaena TaxID=2619674 RepID=UPI000833A4FE|nr:MULTISPECIES: hypothetical protein [unclassified Anabaena]
MSTFTNYLRSLMLSVIFSFVTPFVFIGGVLLFLGVSGYIPLLQELAELCASGILTFLSIFGNGSSLNGILVISLTCGFVGGLFDTYVYYRYQILRLDS